MTDEKLPHYAAKALERLRAGAILVRTSSNTDEAVQKGGGFLYSTHPDGRKFPTASGKLLVDENMVEPRGDGLLEELSQTFSVAPNA